MTVEYNPYSILSTKVSEKSLENFFNNISHVYIQKKWKITQLGMNYA